jgi:hypothetical protein
VPVIAHSSTPMVGAALARALATADRTQSDGVTLQVRASAKSAALLPCKSTLIRSRNGFAMTSIS